MRDSDVRNCYHRCVTLVTEEATVERCRISGSAWHGIRYDNCSPKILNNHIFGNARSGIYASGQTRATVVGNVDSLFSRLAQVAQLPAAMELPGRQLPPRVHHTGPWTDAAGWAPVDFPWSRLDPVRPLAYASMGTLQNGVLRTFRIIAEACTGLDLQLVISLGGG
jgi:hypothetical protein